MKVTSCEPPRPTRTGFVAALLYFAFLILIAYTGVFYGLSNFYTASARRSGSIGDADRAVKFSPKNPAAREALGNTLLVSGKYAAAADSMLKAAALRENDFRLWLAAGGALNLAGDRAAGEAAYRRAAALAPSYARPVYELGKMLLEGGSSAEAFANLSLAADRNFTLYPEVLDLARRTYGDDTAAIETAAPPNTGPARRVFADYFIENKLASPTFENLLTGREFTADEKNLFIKQLIKNENYGLAYNVWLSKNGLSGVRDLILDGGFENLTESDDSGFGWRIDRDISNVSITRSEQGAAAGEAAIAVKFGGGVAPNTMIVSQLVFLKPRSRYRLEFSYRAAEIVTIGPPSIVIREPKSGAVLGRSQQLGRTNEKWLRASAEFETAAAPAAIIGLERAECETAPCPIFGSVALDSFSLAEQ